MSKNGEAKENAKTNSNSEGIDGSKVTDQDTSPTKMAEIEIKEANDVVKNNEDERQYLELVRDIINKGRSRDDRTGTGTLSLFGAQSRYDLRDDKFPLLTTKKVFLRGIIEELLWFVRGCTDGNVLSEKNVHIWDANGTRQFLDKRGLPHRREGDLGPVYGFQWRHFGASYSTCDADYTDQGVDQLAEVVRLCKEDPHSRRIILSAWNPKDMCQMALPPCHCLAQFYVCDGELSCQMYQRAADMGLGVPFNIASYALLTRMIAHVTNLKPGDFVHTLGDAHVYKNHIEPLQVQLAREPRSFPTLKIKGDIKNLEDFVLESFELCNYNPHPAIKMQMAV